MLTPRRWTLTGLAVSALLVGLAVVTALVTEGHAVAVGGHSTISELFWFVWATQPWVILLAVALFSFLYGFFLAHFVAQSQGLYDRIRREGL